MPFDSVTGVIKREPGRHPIVPKQNTAKEPLVTDVTPTLDTGAPELLVDLPSETGEGPLWHEENCCLYWADIPVGKLFRYDPETGANETVYQHDGAIGGYTFQQDGSLILFCEGGAVLRLIGGDTEPVIPEIEALRESRFNDVIADPEGRIFCGSMPLGERPAHLYRLDPDGSLTLVFNDLTLSNGMGFSPDLKTMYLTDSNSRQIFRMDYDWSTGEVGNRQVLIAVPDEGTVPDGMAVDREGNIWSARWDGSGLYKYSPEGELLGKVQFPVRKVSSVTFGGPHYDVAYVTTAGGKQRSAEEGMQAGGLFKIGLKTTGRPPFRSRIGM
jgi:sugar lactone lactonase YvrE